MRLSPPLAVASLFALVGVGALSTSCASLDSIEPGICGNKVLESGEECDGTVPADRFDGGTGFCGAQSAGAGSCHFLCDQHISGSPASTVCPTDEVCSLGDGICRADPAADPTGGGYTFGPLGPPIPGAVRSLVTGDFDGDGLGDVIAVSPAETKLFLGSSKGLSLAFETELVMSGARAAKLTGKPYDPDTRGGFAPSSGEDTTSDLIFLLDQGIAVVTGQPDATLTPAAYPKVDVPNKLVFAGLTFGGEKGDTRAGTPWIFIPYVSGQSTLFDKTVICHEGDLAFAYTETPPKVVKCFPGRTTDDVSGVVAAPLIVDLLSVCPQFVMGFKGDSKVTAFSPCAPNQPTFNPWTKDVTAFDVRLEGGRRLTWGPFVYDVDDDGHPDIVAGAGAGVAVAYGDGALHFQSRPVAGDPQTAGTYGTKVSAWELYPKPDSIDTAVLAVGDLNGDKVPDVVTTRGIFVSAPLVGTEDENFFEVYAASSIPGGAIESAAFGDFNGDGLGDVAIAVTSSKIGVPEVIVLLGSAKHVGNVPLLDPYVVPTDALAFHLVSGDFNGDGLADIAFGQTTDPTLHANGSDPSGATDAITVIYGDRGASFTPVSMGQVKGIDSLVTADILVGSEPFYDGLTDLGVLFNFTDDEKQAHHAAAILGGRPGHLMIAPLGLDKTVGTFLHSAQPLAVASGGFTSATEHADLGAFAIESDSAGTRGKDLQLWRTPLEAAAIAGASSYVSLDTSFEVLASDLDLLGASATTFAPKPGDASWFVALGAGDRSARLWIGRPSDDGAFAPFAIELPAAPRGGATVAPDVRVEAGLIGSAPTIVALVAGELFFVRDPSADAKPVAIEARDTVIDFVLLPRPGKDPDTNQDKGAIVVYATETGLFTFDDALAPVAVNGIDLTTAPRALAVADVDGDRLPDLVVSSFDSLAVFRMMPGP